MVQSMSRRTTLSLSLAYVYYLSRASRKLTQYSVCVCMSGFQSLSEWDLISLFGESDASRGCPFHSLLYYTVYCGQMLVVGVRLWGGLIGTKGVSASTSGTCNLIYRYI